MIASHTEENIIMLRLQITEPDSFGHYDAAVFDDDGNLCHFIEGWTADAENEAHEETYFERSDTRKIELAYAMYAERNLRMW